LARTPGRRRLITLTSDLGAAYAAQMKAVLARSVSPGRLVDLTHDLPAHSVAEAAFVLRAMAVGFPPGTVHLAVIDPGVGGRRAPIVIACRDGSRLVGPDNGVLYPLALALGIRSVHRLSLRRGDAPHRVGTTFDGRDLFAPAAARLAQGAPPARMGPSHRPRPYRVPQPEIRPHSARGQVVHVDRFGNLITNVPSKAVPGGVRRLTVKVGRAPRRLLPLGSSYEALGTGRLGVLGSSFGSLEVSVARGRADRRTHARVGTRVRFAWGPRVRAG
jgi:S-adenosyl-L-methionine hydrolase (adenosine-forming)